MKKAKLRDRFLATLFDYTVIGCFSLVFIYQYGEINSEGGYMVDGIKSFIPLIFWFVYLIVIEFAFNASVGHLILGLRVVKIDGSKIKFIDSLKRHLVDFIDFFFFAVPAILLIKNTSLNQRLGDIWAKTIVIEK